MNELVLSHLLWLWVVYMVGWAGVYVWVISDTPNVDRDGAFKLALICLFWPLIAVAIFVGFVFDCALWPFVKIGKAIGRWRRGLRLPL